MISLSRIASELKNATGDDITKCIFKIDIPVKLLI